jgi:hypothetical protein
MAINTNLIQILRLLKKTAAVYLLLLFLDRPLRVADAARLLEIDRRTARKHLLSLASLGLVTRPGLCQGFILTGPGRQLVLGGEQPSRSPGVVKNPPRVVEFSPPVVVINTTAVKESNNIKSLTAVVEEKPEEISPAGEQAVWDALGAAGITRNSRTERLAQREYLTPDYVTGHYLSLKSRGKGDQTGLLVTILESGAPAPPLNANRHLKDCGCQECRMLKYRTCPYCGEYPCECGEAED